MNTNPYDSPSSNQIDSLQWMIALGIAVLGVVLGGYLCGCAIDRFGSRGSVSVWALGGALGWTTRKFLSPSRFVGYVLISAVILALVVAETCWIKWNIVGVETWPQAIGKLWLFVQTYQVDSLVACLMAFFGANSAFRQTGRN